MCVRAYVSACVCAHVGVHAHLSVHTRARVLHARVYVRVSTHVCVSARVYCVCVCRFVLLNLSSGMKNTQFNCEHFDNSFQIVATCLHEIWCKAMLSLDFHYSILCTVHLLS